VQPRKSAKGTNRNAKFGFVRKTFANKKAQEEAV
jgi:hypothetical protein